MLTLILLVVLGGGVGILAVSMAERKPATNDPDSRRAQAADEAEETGAPEPHAASDREPEPRPEPAPETAPVETHVPEPEPPPAPEPEPVPASMTAPGTTSEPADRPAFAPRRGVGPERRPHRGSVPASQTAVEGPLGDLIRPSFPRRILSLVGIAVIVVGVGIGIAAVLGAIVGGAAELVGNAIG